MFKLIKNVIRNVTVLGDGGYFWPMDYNNLLTRYPKGSRVGDRGYIWPMDYNNLLTW